MEPASANATPLLRPQVMTFVLLAVNIVVFIAMLWHDWVLTGRFDASLEMETLIRFGAKQNGLVATGQLERLVVPMFLHANLVHLAVNMYALYYLGRYLELVAGSWTLLLVYLVTGITGNVFSFALLSPLADWSTPLELLIPAEHPGGGGLLSVGASSSIFGLITYLFVLERYQVWLARKHRVPLRETTNLGSMLVLNVIITFAIPFIDWASHLGGAIGGGLLGIGMVCRNYREFKLDSLIRYLSHKSDMPGCPLWQREAFWPLVLIAVNAACLSKIAWIDRAEKILGLGLLTAAHEPIQARELTSLQEFQDSLVGEKAATDPNRLLQIGLALHQEQRYDAAFLVYQVVAILRQGGVGSMEFLHKDLIGTLEQAAAQARIGAPLPQLLQNEFPLRAASADDCMRPAIVFRNLGFFEISAPLAECAAQIAPEREDALVEAVGNYWRAGEVGAMYRFLRDLPVPVDARKDN